LSTVLLHPTFPADEFTGLRQRKIVESRLRLSRPSTIAYDTAQRILFAGHPAAIAAPSPEALSQITLDMLPTSHRERYTPGSTVVSYIGRVKPAAVVSQLEKLLSGWKAPSVTLVPPPIPQRQTARRIVLVDRPGAAQTELVIGNVIFDRRDPDLFPFAVTNSLLGGNISSRLYRILREEKGYVFSVTSVYTATRFPGFFQVRAGARTDATADAVGIILDQLKRICDEPIPAAELESGKRAVVGNFALNLERPATVLNQSYLRYRYGFSLDYWDRWPAKMSAVTAAEAQAVAQKYMDPARTLVVAVGDASKVRSGLERFGKVELLAPGS
jgi:predicted Zn-dependent peptidase